MSERFADADVFAGTLAISYGCIIGGLIQLVIMLPDYLSPSCYLHPEVVAGRGVALLVGLPMSYFMLAAVRDWSYRPGSRLRPILRSILALCVWGTAAFVTFVVWVESMFASGLD